MTTLYQQATVTDDHWIHIQHPQLPAGTEIGVVLIFGQTLISPQPAAFWERIQGMMVDGLPSDYSSRFEEYAQSEESR
jgi:hypothetical protein